MEILVGVSRDDSGRDAVALAAALARLLNATIALGHVHAATVEHPSVGNIDAEWEAYLADESAAVIAAAREWLADCGGPIDAESAVVGSASVGRGLRDLAETRGSSIIVVGPGSDGASGRVCLGPVAHSLLHGGPAAIALAPEGYRESAPDSLGRVVVGFQDTRESAAAVDIVDAMVPGVPIHLLTVVMRATRILEPRLGRDAERPVMESLARADQAAQDTVIARLSRPADGTVVQADSAAQAMADFDWTRSDLFVVASSRLGMLSRVFLGDMTHKLLRACRVPAMVLPRHGMPE